MRKLIIPIACITLILTACESTRMVSAEVFSKNTPRDYETFGFAELQKKVKVNRVDTEKTREFIQVAILDLMEEKGYVYSEENPDMWVDMDLSYIKTRESSSTYTRNSPYVGRNRFYSGRYNYNYNDLNSERFAREDNLIARVELLFADAAGKKKLWKGAVETKFAGRLDKRILRLETAINKLIVGFEEGEEK